MDRRDKKVIKCVNSSDLKEENFLLWEAKYLNMRSKVPFIFGSSYKITLFTSEGFSVFSIMDWLEFLDFSLQKNEFILCIKVLYQITDGNKPPLRNIPRTKKLISEQVQPLIEVLFSKMIPKVDKTKPNEVSYFTKSSMNLLVRAGL